MREGYLSAERPLSGLDEGVESALRPRTFKGFFGQEKVKGTAEVFVSAARERGEALDHMLLHGPPGLGKTTLAHIVAHELGVGIKTITGPVLDKPADLAGLLTGLSPRDVLFIDEIHRLSPAVEEYLYPAMEDSKIDILLDKGANARSIEIDLPAFTLIGATTRSGLLSKPLRERFGIPMRLEYYSTEVLLQITIQGAKFMRIHTERNAAYEIARRSRGTPRICNHLLRRTRDFAQVKGRGKVDKEIVKMALEALGVDENGLDEMDNQILSTIVNKFNGGPVGISSIAIACGEEAGTIEEVYEPFLIQEGYVKRTPRGRAVTQRAYEHLGLPVPQGIRTPLFG